MTHTEEVEIPYNIKARLAEILETVDEDRYEEDGRFDGVVREILEKVRIEEPQEEIILKGAKHNIDWLFENYNNLKRLWPQQYIDF